MRGVNKAIIVGTLGRDPETRYTAGGNAVTTFSLATNEEWKDKTTGEKQKRTDWHNIVTFGRTAEIAGEYLRKGSQVYIEGKLQTEKYEKDGITRYATKIIAQSIQMLGGKGERTESAEPEIAGGDGFNDDIPF